MATIRHTRKGSKVDYTQDGKRKIKFFSKKKYGADAKKLAEDLYKKKLAEIELGIVTDSVKVVAAKIYFAEILRQYNTQHLQTRTRATNNKSFLKTLIIHWGDREVFPNFSITRVEFQDWIWKANHEPIESPRGMTQYAPKSIDKLIIYAVAALNWAIKREIIPGPNPLADIKDDDISKLHRRRGTKKRKFLSEEDFWGFMNKPWIPELFADVIKVIWASGMRRSEAVNLTWNQVNGNIIEIDAHDTKEAYEKTVVVDPIGVEVLNKLKNAPKHASDRVFLNSKGDPLSEKTLSTWWRVNADRFAEESGNEDFYHFALHDLRRSYRTRLDLRGVPMSVAKRQLGHHSDRMSEHYNIVDTQRQMSVLGNQDNVSLEVKRLLSEAVLSGTAIEDLHAALQKLYVDSKTKTSEE